MKCSPGDLAIITRSGVTANLGAVVEVLRPWSKRPGWWWVRSLAGPRLSNDGTFREFATVAETALAPMQPTLPMPGFEIPALEQVALASH